MGTKEQNQSRRLHKMVGLLTPPSTDIELDDEDSQAEIVRAGGFRSMKVDDNCESDVTMQMLNKRGLGTDARFLVSGF